MADLFGQEEAAASADQGQDGLFAHVALEQGIDAVAAGLTYRVPEALSHLRVGDRVLVPLGRGNKPTPGYITAFASHSDVPAGKLKAILERDPHGVGLPVDLIDLARWMASYYVCPLGMVFSTMLPAAVKRGTGTQVETHVALADPAPEPMPRLTKLQSAIRNEAAKHHDGIELKLLADLAGARSTSPVKQLIDKGVLTTRRISTVRASWGEALREFVRQPATLTLNASQQRALDHLFDRIDSGFGVHLLHGVTGSGKTEVYLRLIERVVEEDQASGVSSQVSAVAAQGTGSIPHHPSALGPPPSATAGRPGAIVLVPEIALTPQTVARFFSRFGTQQVAVMHSALTAAQRHEQWRRIREGEARIVIGARSAVFAPLDHCRVLIVDEEQESSYKQDQLPRYHARDVAIKRAHRLNIPVVLGSATPSLESYLNARGFESPAPSTGAAAAPNHGPDHESGAAQGSLPVLPPRPHWHYLHLPDRVAKLVLPKVELVDLRQERRKRYQMTGKGGVHLLSLKLEHALRQTLRNGGQAMLLLNRRGYANYIACPDHGCGWMMTCDYCDATMVYHKDSRLPAGGLLKCHHCEAEQLLPATCPLCGKKVTVFGLGTQRVEEELQHKFPGVSMLRMDSDAMRGGQEYEASLEAFRTGQVQLLLGTQMIAKGLDFPNVRLVGVISGDTSLHMPDFRAAERSFQLIAQVAGRAGRGEHGGHVIVQTFSPDDPVINLAAKHDYETFATRELAYRAQVGLPPVTRMARIVVRDKEQVACHERAAELARHLQAANTALGSRVRLRGPAPCPIARIAEFHRMQIELMAPDASLLQRLLTDLRNARLLVSDARTAVDVDPVDLL